MYVVVGKLEAFSTVAARGMDAFICFRLLYHAFQIPSLRTAQHLLKKSRQRSERVRCKYTRSENQRYWAVALIVSVQFAWVGRNMAERVGFCSAQLQISQRDCRLACRGEHLLGRGRSAPGLRHPIHADRDHHLMDFLWPSEEKTTTPTRSLT
jgi:hypothetical protein